MVAGFKDRFGRRVGKLDCRMFAATVAKNERRGVVWAHVMVRSFGSRMETNQSPRMTQYMVESRVFGSDPFFLVDVGASGGIGAHWRHFKDQLAAVGFDPLVKEVERLNAQEQDSPVRYVASLVGCRAMGEAPVDAFHAFFRGTSSVRAAELLQCNFADEYYDDTHTGVSTREMVELDEFFSDRLAGIDFIKTDIDGHDIEALRGARKLLLNAGPLGVASEVLLLGPDSPDANLFSNVEPYLRELGYSLFAIEPHFYTRTALPKPFRWHQPADTHSGRACWANTLFIRDVCLPDYEERFGVALTPGKLLKLCCLHELYGYEDCAAEVLLRFRERIEPFVDVPHCLDLLTPPLPDGRKVSYREYIDFFEKNVKAFFSGC